MHDRSPSPSCRSSRRRRRRTRCSARPRRRWRRCRRATTRRPAFLRRHFAAVMAGEAPAGRYRAFYPQVSLTTASFAKVDSRLSFGHVTEPGRLRDDDHPAAPLRGLPHPADRAPDPEPRDAGPGRHLGHADSAPLRHGRGRACGGLDRGRAAPAAARPLRRARPQHHRRPHRQRRRPAAGRSGARPLAPFTAQRIDYSLARLAHYTATSPTHFQNHVLFTNYQFYMDEFVEFAAARARGSRAPATRPSWGPATS